MGLTLSIHNGPGNIYTIFSQHTYKCGGVTISWILHHNKTVNLVKDVKSTREIITPVGVVLKFIYMPIKPDGRATPVIIP